MDRFVDVYGNHDIWPGTLPAAALGSVAPGWRRPFGGSLNFKRPCRI